MRVLITGVSGFIGSATAELLVNSNVEVVGIDNLSTSDISNVPKGIEFIKSDISDGSFLQKIGKLDACIHFAGLIESGQSMKDPRLYFKNNVAKTLIFLENIKHHGIEKLVFSSSAAVYGDSKGAHITEETVTDPSSVYGETKLMIDRTLDWISKLELMKSVSLRFFNAAGSFNGNPENHQNETHLIPLAIDAVLGRNESFTIFGNDYPTPDGTCIRDYVHVEDLARAHILALQHLETNSRLVANIGTGKGFSNLEVIHAIEKCAQRELPICFAPRREGDPPILVADNTVAREQLGWLPNKTVLECINDALNSRIEM